MMTKEEYETLADWRYTLRRFLHFSEAAAQAAGVTPQQYQALLMIRGFRGRDCVTIGELAERMVLHHHSAVGLVNRLVAQELVERRPASDDRRQVFVGLTPHGMEVIEQLSHAHRSEIKQIGPQLIEIVEALIV